MRSELHANRGGSDHHAGTAPANQRLRQAPTTFHIILAVWGSSYREQMVHICIPALLAPGNVPALRAFGDVKIVIVTAQEDEQALRHHPLFHKLAGLAELVFINFHPDQYANAHAALSAAHRLAIDFAMAENACGIILTPDLICSDSALLSVGRAAAAGTKALLVSGLRLQAETAIPSLTSLGLPTSEGDHPILAPRNLVAFALQHLHPEVLRSCTDSDEFNPYPTFFIWPVHGKGLLQRSFHLYPLLIDFRAIDRKALDTLEYSSIDGAFVHAAFPQRDAIHVEQDSDNIAVFSFSPAQERTHPPAKNRFSTALLRKAAYRYNVDPLHRHLFTKPIFLHTGDLDAEWRTLEAETTKTAGQARTLFGELSAMLPLSQATRHALAMMPTYLSFCLREAAFRSRHRLSFFVREATLRFTHWTGFLARNWNTRLSFLVREARFRFGSRLEFWTLYCTSHLWPAARERRYRIGQRTSFLLRETRFRVANRTLFFMREARFRITHRVSFFVRERRYRRQHRLVA